ncbi:MAG: hypothetical protein QM803_12565 [Rhodocyclaceae bacterium]
MGIRNVIVAAAAAASLLPLHAVGQNEQAELFNLTKQTGNNYCYLLLNKNADRQAAVNQLRISPAQACDCTSTEAARAIEANPQYHAYLRAVIRSADVNRGQPPRFEYNVDQDAAMNEYASIFNRSWENCVRRLAR